MKGVYEMPRQNITHLRVKALPKRYRRGLRKEARTADFETIAASLAEDGKRQKRFKRNMHNCNVPGLGRRQPMRLYNEFSGCLAKGKVPKSAASSRRMRRTRWHLTAWLRHLYLTEPATTWVRPSSDRKKFHTSWKQIHNPAFVDILPRSPAWIVPADRLFEVDAVKLLEQLRIDLTRKGGVPKYGWAFFGLHGAYFEATDHYHIHAHGLVSGEMIERCLALKANKMKYGPRRNGRSPASESGATPVEFIHEAPKDLWRQTAYRFQSFWPVGGKERRNRIPEPRHSQWLMWMDRYQPSDLCLMIGLRVEQGKLVRTGKAYMNR